MGKKFEKKQEETKKKFEKESKVWLENGGEELLKQAKKEKKDKLGLSSAKLRAQLASPARSILLKPSNLARLYNGHPYRSEELLKQAKKEKKDKLGLSSAKLRAQLASPARSILLKPSNLAR